MILVYHNISNAPFFDLTSVSPKRFKKDMELIQGLDLRCVGIGELLSTTDKSGLVGLGFDDGYKDIVEFALPILNSLNFKATVFPVAGYIGKKSGWDPFLGKRKFHLDRNNLNELIKLGFELGSHTMTHRNLTKLPPKELQYELQKSFEILSDIAGKPIDIVSFPFSIYSEDVLRKAFDIGYKYCLTIRGPIYKYDRVIRGIPVYRYEPSLFMKLKLRQSKLEYLRTGFISSFSRFSAMLR